MRLASKIFLTSVLGIVVLASAGALSLRAVGRLVSANREITTQTLPALRLAGEAREAVAQLARLEARALVLRDARYATLSNERAAQVGRDLERLRAHATTPLEAARLEAAREAFQGYQAVVARQRELAKRGEVERAIRLSETDAFTFSGRV